MKILIISDIHGNYLGIKKVIEDNNDFDYLFILGDLLGGFSNNNDLISLLNSYNNKIIAVRGNNDYYDERLNFSNTEYYITIPVDKKLYLLTHGHMYHENSFPNLDYDIYIQGHTHIPKMERKENRLYLNPGSITYPRGGSIKTYIYYEDGIFYLKELDSNQIIKKINI